MKVKESVKKRYNFMFRDLIFNYWICDKLIESQTCVN